MRIHSLIDSICPTTRVVLLCAHPCSRPWGESSEQNGQKSPPLGSVKPRKLSINCPNRKFSQLPPPPPCPHALGPRDSATESPKYVPRAPTFLSLLFLLPQVPPKINLIAIPFFQGRGSSSERLQNLPWVTQLVWPGAIVELRSLHAVAGGGSEITL